MISPQWRPDVTLCICSYNRPDELRRALQSVVASNSRQHPVLVSDDSANHQTILDVVADFPGVECVRGPRLGVGANRRATSQRVHTSHLIFIDDDAVVGPDFFPVVERIIDESTEHDVVTGHIINHYTDGEVQAKRPGSADFLGFETRPWGQGHGNMIEMNATVFPRAAFDEVAFDPRLKYGYEELDISRQLVAAGYRVRFDDRLFVDHYPEEVRSGYRGFADAARMYATWSYYAQVRRSPGRAAAYTVVAPTHHLLAAASRRHPGLTLPEAVRHIRAAAQMVTQRCGETRRRNRQQEATHGG
jgi:GT2 family glycosyltransferase